MCQLPHVLLGGLAACAAPACDSSPAKLHHTGVQAAPHGQQPPITVCGPLAVAGRAKDGLLSRLRIAEEQLLATFRDEAASDLIQACCS